MWSADWASVYVNAAAAIGTIGAFVVGAGVFIMFTVFLGGAFGDERIENHGATAIEALGESLFRNYVLPFEAVSVLLLAALIGAIVLARRD